ncbi:hypothetical protein L0F63_002534 [Massospora cicadina]|nr:hypothetical protein L0F63_002534 [Massospora cicadina]
MAVGLGWPVCTGHPVLNWDDLGFGRWMGCVERWPPSPAKLELKVDLRGWTLACALLCIAMSFTFPLRSRRKRCHQEAMERNSPLPKRRTCLAYVSGESYDVSRSVGPILEEDVELDLRDRQFAHQLQDVLLDDPTVKVSTTEDDFLSEIRLPPGLGRGGGGPSRTISRAPYCTVQSEDLEDNFYYNLLAWSSTDILAVGLGNQVYLRNCRTGDTTFFLELTCGRSPTSLCWSPSGHQLGIGLTNGEVFVYDTVKVQMVGNYREHASRVCALDWSRESLASGSADTQIILKDFRRRSTGYRKLEGHPTEVCGLRWSPDGMLLASGSLSEEVLVFDRRSRAPYSKLGGHRAAVKALAWNPRNPNLLATGTGLGDRLVRVWDVEMSQLQHAVNTGSQVSGLAWSPSGAEVVSSHGFQSNEVVVWRYPSLHQVVRLAAHTNRIAYLARSPDGTSVATGSGHEKVCFWKLFPPYSPLAARGSNSPSPSLLFPRQTVR